MKKNNRNTRIIAINNGTKNGFNIFIDFSGQREFIMFHRHNGILFNALKDGISLNDIHLINFRDKSTPYRDRGQKRRMATSERALKHLVCVIEDYLTYRVA